MIRSLLAGAIDYAGLFPPAALAMHEAVQRFDAYRRGADAWALGRFVVRASALGELAAAAAGVQVADDDGAHPWRISALLAGSGRRELDTIAAFNDTHGDRQREGDRGARARWSAAVDAVEVRAGATSEIATLPSPAAGGVETFVEIPVERDPLPLLEAVAARGFAAKIRTGGVTTEAFPTARNVARFISACTALGLRFKATAGLHHPLRAEHRLTYAPDSDRGTMFGFLNVMIATAIARDGAPEDDLVKILEEGNAGSFGFSDDGAAWDGHRLTVEDATHMRERGMVSFGSCSFDEPLADLRALHLLQGPAPHAR